MVQNDKEDADRVWAKRSDEMSENVVFCGLHISTEEGIIKVKSYESLDIEKAEVRGLSNESDLTQEGKTWARSIIGKLPWSAQSHRPDLCFWLGQALSNVTKERQKKTLK